MIRHIYANRSNVGDWLSARGIQSLLGPLTLTEHLCDDPFLEETLAALTAATPDDFIIIGGGGLFMDYFVAFWEGFRAIAERVPFCLWGVGVCDMKRRDTGLPRDLLVSIVRQSRFCSVRDELTRAYLTTCHLPPPVPCPTFAAVAPAVRPGHGLLHSDNYDNVGEAIYQFMAAEGRRFAEETGRPYRKTNNLITAGHRAALAEVLALYASCDLVLTSRLHGCVLALALGRKVLAVSGDRKMESFMQAAGLGEWLLDLEAIDCLPKRLRELPRQQFPSHFVQRARAANDQIAEHVRVLARISTPQEVAKGRLRVTPSPLDGEGVTAAAGVSQEDRPSRKAN